MTRVGKWLFPLLAALVLGGSTAHAKIIAPSLSTAPAVSQTDSYDMPSATASELTPDQSPNLQPPPLVYVPESCVVAEYPPLPGDILLARDFLGRIWFMRVEYAEVHNGEFCYALSPLGLCGESIAGSALRGFGESLWNDGLSNMAGGFNAIVSSPYNAVVGASAYAARLWDDPSGTLNGTFNNPANAIQNTSWNSFENFMADGPAVALAVWGGGTMALGMSPSAASAEISVWSLGPGPRGMAIEAQLGGNLPRGFPVIDRFEGGVATSIKSIDLNASSYQSSQALTSRLNGYVDSLADFTGARRGDTVITASDIATRQLQLAIPANSASAVQQAAINAAVARAQSMSVQFTVTPIR